VACTSTIPLAPTADVDTIVFVHGLWMTPLSWEHWATRGAWCRQGAVPGRQREPQPQGWEATADDALSWALANVRTP
jgi:hypothetical protein